MPLRLRKFIGALVLIAFVCVYALVAMALAQGRITTAPNWLQGVLYCVLGLVWVLPAMLIIRWMEGPRRRPQA